MKKISSGTTFFSKKVFPLIWFGFLALFVLGPVLGGDARQEPAFFLVPIFMAGFGFFIMRKLVWDLVDEVYDCGTFLLVRNAGEEDSVPLPNIMNVSVSNYQNPPRITLRLIRPCKFGSEVAFAPIRPFTLNPFAKSEIGEDLIKRVYDARSGSQ